LLISKSENRNPKRFQKSEYQLKMLIGVFETLDFYYSGLFRASDFVLRIFR